MNFFVVDPEWGFWIIAYFYLGGIAAGSYFLAILIEWFGSEEDLPLARIAFRIAFPLLLVSVLCLIVDLGRPERFWHMMLKSEVTGAAFAAGFPFTGRGWALAVQAPIFKYWSPMSAGSLGLGVFGACSFVSFVAELWGDRKGLRWLQAHWIHRILQVVGCVSGFFIASYTGALLSATNQPMWSETPWLAPLFLASAASTSLAAMTLIAWRRNIGAPEARRRLEGSEPLALGLELVVLGAFLASLGGELFAVLMTVRGNIMVFGTLVVGILAPLLIHALARRGKRWATPAATACVLLGGLLLRYGAITTPGEMLARGPAVQAAFAPEEDRRRGQPGADVDNRAGPVVVPQSKLPLDEPGAP